jgi:hypothetical protein
MIFSRGKSDLQKGVGGSVELKQRLGEAGDGQLEGIVSLLLEVAFEGRLDVSNQKQQSSTRILLIKLNLPSVDRLFTSEASG